MRFINDLRTKVGRLLLGKSALNNTVAVPSMESVINIGILYDASNNQSEEQVQRIASQLRHDGKKVFLMGFVNQKQLPHKKVFHLTSEYFWLQQLNFFNIPDADKIGKFLQQPFDLLINLYFDDILPLQALSAKSSAKYIIGSNSKLALQYNNAVIDCGSNKTLINLASQVVHYLNIIKA